MNWITDRVPENSHDVLVSLSYDEQARIGFYVEQKFSWGTSRVWHVWEGDVRHEYGPSYVDGWMPIPPSIFTLNQTEAKE